ncbi:hypothetical protein CP1MG86_MNBNLCLN_01341 [Companilactobacillus paralimentarius]
MVRCRPPQQENLAGTPWADLELIISHFVQNNGSLSSAFILLFRTKSCFAFLGIVKPK